MDTIRPINEDITSKLNIGKLIVNIFTKNVSTSINIMSNRWQYLVESLHIRPQNGLPMVRSSYVNSDIARCLKSLKDWQFGRFQAGNLSSIVLWAKFIFANLTNYLISIKSFSLKISTWVVKFSGDDVWKVRHSGHRGRFLHPRTWVRIHKLL